MYTATCLNKSIARTKESVRSNSCETFAKECASRQLLRTLRRCATHAQTHYISMCADDATVVKQTWLRGESFIRLMVLDGGCEFKSNLLYDVNQCLTNVIHVPNTQKHMC